MLLNTLLLCFVSTVLSVTGLTLSSPQYASYQLFHYSGFISIICSGVILFLSLSKIKSLDFFERVAFVGWGVFLTVNHLLSLFIKYLGILGVFVGIAAMVAALMNFYCDEITSISGGYAVCFLLFTIFRLSSNISFVIAVVILAFVLYVLTHVKKYVAYVITKVSITGLTGVYLVNSCRVNLFDSFYDSRSKTSKTLLLIGLIVWIVTIIASVLIEFFFDDVKKKAAEMAVKSKAKQAAK